MKNIIVVVLLLPIFTRAAGLDYLLNGVTTPVKIDTATPANSRAYPFSYYNSLGVKTDLGTDASLQTINTSILGVNTTLGSIDFATETTLLAISGKVLTDTQLRASPVPVSGPLTDLQLRASAVPVSLATVPLPTGAATEATLSAINSKTPALGQAASAASTPVTIASDQSPVPVKNTDAVAVGTITAINGNVAITTLDGFGALAVQVVGTYTGAITIQGSVDGTTWIAIPVINANTGALTATIASATQGIFWADIGALKSVRAIALAAVTGTATVSLKASAASNIISLATAIPAGANNIGTVGIAAGSQVIGSVTVATPVAKTVKQAAITVGTTAVRATTDGAAVTAGRVLLTMRLDPASSAACYYGSSSVTSAGSTRGMLLFPGESVERIKDAGDYYLICDTAGQTVFIVEQE